MSVSREIVELEQEQGVEEEIIYTLTTTPWGSTPTSTSHKGYKYDADTGAWTDVTSTIFPSGSTSVVGDVITLPLCKAMTQDALYRVEVKFTSGGNIFEPYALIRARR